MSYKPLSVIAMETVVESLITAGSVAGLLTGRLSPDAVTAIWGMILAYAFKNGVTYVNRDGKVMAPGPAPEPSPSVGPG